MLGLHTWIFTQRTIVYNWQAAPVQHIIRHIFLVHLQPQLLWLPCCFSVWVFVKHLKPLWEGKLWDGVENNIQVLFNLLALFNLFFLNNGKRGRLHAGCIVCRVLEAAISTTLASGRIEWSFRLSEAAWPFSPSVAWQYVCDTTGLYRCPDECLRSRSWQRQRAVRRGEGGEGPLLAAVDYAQGIARVVWRTVLIFHISLYNEQHVFVFKMYLKSICCLKNEML